MDGVIVYNIRRWANLSDEEGRKIQEELAALDVDVTVPSWAKRVRVLPDGRLALAIENVAFKSEMEAGFPGGDRYLLVREELLPPAAAVALLRGEPAKNPEIEVARRRQIVAEQDARRAEQEMGRRAAEEARGKQAAEAQRRWKEFAGNLWDQLPNWARLCFRRALQCLDRGDVAAAEDWWTLGQEALVNGQVRQDMINGLGQRVSLGLSFPGRDWRRRPELERTSSLELVALSREEPDSESSAPRTTIPAVAGGER